VKNPLFIFLLVLVFGIGFVVGQIKGPQKTDMSQNVNSQQRTNQSMSENQQGKGSLERIVQGSQNQTRRTLDISRTTLIANHDDSTEPSQPPHESMDFPQVRGQIPDPKQLSPDQFPTQEEGEEDHMRSLWELGASLEEIQLTARRFEEEKENMKQRLAIKQFEAPPPPSEESSDQK
jgi:hypothetical protein